MFKRFAAPFVAAGLLLCCSAHATIVQFQTSMGDFEINLYDQSTPETVANFLAYVEDGAYEDTIVHRSVPGFVIQGGGFAFSGELPLDSVQTTTPVINEPEWSNVRATIAMAKLGGNVNSATSQWFINLSDNSTKLDNQNGGFTVFGEVMLDGMDIVDAMARVTVYNAGGALSDIPLRDHDPAAGEDPDESNFIMIFNVVVLDAAEDTAADAEPVPNTLVNQPAPKKKKSSGTFAPLLLLLLVAVAGRRRFGRARK